MESVQESNELQGEIKMVKEIQWSGIKALKTLQHYKKLPRRAQKGFKAANFNAVFEQGLEKKYSQGLPHFNAHPLSHPQPLVMLNYRLIDLECDRLEWLP